MNVSTEINKLSDDLIWSFYDVEEYKILFTEDEARISLLNDTASTFFVKLHEYYWNRFILSISRMTDPGIQRSNRNLSIDLLKDFIDIHDPSLKDNFDTRIKEIRSLAKPITKLRSKYIVHRDLENAVVSTSKKDKIQLDLVEEILSKIGDCINDILVLCNKGTIWFRPAASSHGTRSLLYYLKQGAVYSEIKKKRRNHIIDTEEMAESKYKDA